MYESFFQLQSRPFLAAPLAARYFASASSEQARATVARCVERGEGPAVIMGPAGSGKSMLCHVLAEQFRGRFPTVMLASARLCTRRALLQNILFELNLPYRDREEGELRLALLDYLQPDETVNEGILLIVDEAHTLPLRLIEEIRLLTNLVRDGQPRVRLVLAADLQFDERLASPRLESLNQRLAARCYLHPLSGPETTAFIQAQIKSAGSTTEQIFAPAALQAVYRATGGVPRLINQVCDHALLLASLGGHSPLHAAGIEEAWADLQQLPAPWSRAASAAPAAESSPILEFGELEDEPDDSPDPTVEHDQAQFEPLDGEQPKATAGQSCADQPAPAPADTDEPPGPQTSPAGQAPAAEPTTEPASPEPARDETELAASCAASTAVEQQPRADRPAASGDPADERPAPETPPAEQTPAAEPTAEPASPEPASAEHRDEPVPVASSEETADAELLQFPPPSADTAESCETRTTSQVAARSETGESSRTGETELTIHVSPDPFGESFEDEEVVVDPVASLEVLNTPHSSLASVEDTCRTIVLDMSGVAGVNVPSEAATPSPEAPDGASPGPADNTSASLPSGEKTDAAEAATVRLPAPGNPAAWLDKDDRDLLEVVEGVCDMVDLTAEKPPAPPQVRPYRHLFATLRGKTGS